MATQIAKNEIELAEIAKESVSGNKIYEYEEVQEGDVVVVDLDKAKERISELLKDYASIDALAEIILYNTETYLRFIARHPESCNFEGYYCSYREYYNEEIDGQDSYDCDGERCILCPWYSFIPRGFKKFESCNKLDGLLDYNFELDTKKIDPDVLAELKNIQGNN